MALQHLRSSTANKRPNPAAMADGQLAANTNNGSPGLFFKDSNGALVKVGPVHVGTTAPNASPASGGTAGNSIGEQWLDTSSSKYVFKIWDGTAWRSEAGEFVDAAGDVMTGALGIIAGTAGAPGLYISGDTNTGLYSPAADQLALSTGGTGRLFIDDGGRIMAGVSTALTNAYAIGTALTPAVQIQGNTANAAALSITRNTSAAANLLLQRGVTGTPVADTEALGQISFNGFDGSNYFNAALIRSVVDGTPGTGSMPGRLSFQTTPTGSTTPVERLRLDPAGQILAASLGTASLPVWSFTGDPNTGIYSPGADQLSVSTGGTQRFNVSTTAVSSTLPIDHPLGTASAPGITFTGDLNTGIYSPGADTLAISTNGAQRVTVDSTGRVGIGTSAPAHILDVRGTDNGGTTYLNIANNSTTATSLAGIYFSGAGVPKHSITAATFGADYMAFNVGSAGVITERMRIDSSGRVGIGTTSPGTVFEAAFTAGTGTPRVRLDQTSSNPYVELQRFSGVSNEYVGTRIRSSDNTAGLVFERASSAALGSQTFVESARIDSSGRLLVGTSSANSDIYTDATTYTPQVQIKGSTNNTSSLSLMNTSSAGPSLYLNAGSSAGGLNTDSFIGGINFNGWDGLGYKNVAQIEAFIDTTPGNNDMPGRLTFSTTADGASSVTERMRIQNNGTITFGTGTNISPAVNGVAGLVIDSLNNYVAFVRSGFEAVGIGRLTSDGAAVRFYRDATNVGNISVTTTATTYNSGSDYRLKENVTPIAGGITRLKQLKPSQFNFIVEPDIVVDGFIAHEVQEVVPQAVTGEKDEVDANGKPIYQGIDQSKLVPLLTAALQEAIGEIESLKARLTAAGI